MAKVLVIEDNENIRLLFEMFLTDAGHDVILAENGARGLEILHTDPLPNIILLDLVMPDIDGHSVAENIYKDNRLSKIPIIIISGSTNTPRNVIFNDAYCTYIAKPFDLDDVLTTIEKFTIPKDLNGRL